MFPPVNRLRMQNMFGPQQPRTYPSLYDRFVSEIAPLAHESLARERKDKLAEREQQDYQTELGRREQEVARNTRLAEIGKGVTESIQPLDTKYEGITPYQQEIINLRKMELGQKGELGEGRLDIQRDTLTERTRANQAKEDVSRKRAQVYEWKARNPNMVIKAQLGGNFYAINPQTGAKIDTGIPTGTMDELEAANLERDFNIERIGETARQTQETQRQKSAAETEADKARGWEIYHQPDGKGGYKSVLINKITHEVKDLISQGQNVGPVTKPGTTDTDAKGELPTQTKVRQYTTARQIANSNPQLGKWIKFGPGVNEFSITPPATGRFGSGPTPDEYATIQRMVYGEGGIPINQPGRTNAPVPIEDKPPAQIPAGATPGGKWIKTKSGRWVYMGQ